MCPASNSGVRAMVGSSSILDNANGPSFTWYWSFELISSVWTSSLSKTPFRFCIEYHKIPTRKAKAMIPPMTPPAIDPVLVVELRGAVVTVAVTVEIDDDEVIAVVEFLTLTALPLMIRNPLPCSQQTVLSNPSPQQ